MEEVNKLHHTVQSMRVQATVANATSSLKDGGTGEDQGSRMSKSAAAMSSSMRTALEREFVEKKTLLEQRWDHALHLVTDQMKKQRDEQVALAVSKFDVEQRLKFQAEISKGLERVEAAARQEVGGERQRGAGANHTHQMLTHERQFSCNPLHSSQRSSQRSSQT